MALDGRDGAAICGDCVLRCHDTFGAAARPPLEPMTDAELLGNLPLIADAADQVAELLVQWVRHARSRRISWREIGTALGVSRQAAWQRFAQRLE
jgi:hypothetical protein